EPAGTNHRRSKTVRSLVEIGLIFAALRLRYPGPRWRSISALCRCPCQRRTSNGCWRGGLIAFLRPLISSLRGTSKATGARRSERGISKCHVRLKFLTGNLAVTAQRLSYVRVVIVITNPTGECQWPILKH